jgi:hypothetical protein
MVSLLVPVVAFGKPDEALRSLETITSAIPSHFHAVSDEGLFRLRAYWVRSHLKHPKWYGYLY